MTSTYMLIFRHNTLVFNVMYLHDFISIKSLPEHGNRFSSVNVAAICPTTLDE